MAGSDRVRKPGMILHVPSNEARARSRGAALARGPKNRRPVPPDLAEVSRRLGGARRALAQHYATGDATIARWVKEAGLELVRQSSAPKNARGSVAAPRDFDMALDGARWQAMQGAMTLNGRAVRGEVWRKEARGEYD